MLHLCVVIKSSTLLWLHLCHFYNHTVKTASTQKGDSLEASSIMLGYGSKCVLCCVMLHSVFTVKWQVNVT